MKRIAIILPLALILCSCSSGKKRHIGLWDATGKSEQGYSVRFEDKGKAQVITPEGVFAGEYAIDYSKKPIQLDVTWDGKTTKCILEFLKGNKEFMIIGESDPGKLRPLAFKPVEDVVVFRKIVEDKKKKKR